MNSTFHEIRETFSASTRWVFNHYFDPITIPTRWAWRRLFTRAA